MSRCFPGIPDAKALATKHGCAACIVIGIGGDGSFGIASWGHDRRKCDAAGSVVDQLHDLISSGEICVPDALNGGAR